MNEDDSAVGDPLATDMFEAVAVQQVGLDCRRIVQSAVYAAGCALGLMLVDAGDRLQVTEVVGAKRSGIPPESILVDRIRSLPASGILTLNDDDPESASVKALLDEAETLGFVAATHVADAAGTVLGALIIADRRKRVGLSAAQNYVLLTQAAQLASLLVSADFPESVELRQIVAAQGVTERLRLLESVVVNANDAVLITEAEPVELPGPRIVYVNKAFETTTGYLEAEVLGKTPRILQADAIDRGALAKLKAALVAWKPVEVELLNRRKDGSEFWVELSIVPVANEKGWFTHWVSVQRDVSHRKRTDEIATRARVAEAENQAFAAEILERKRIEARLLYEAYHDDLTTLCNRSFFMDRLAFVLERADELNTVIFLDLDGFKLVNDSLGHNAGDLLLLEVAQRLRTCVRSQDTLARIGGDEFAVLLEGAGVQTGVEVAERMIRALREPVRLASQQVYCLCSIGIAQSSGQPLRPDEFLRNADIAMYEAKKQGLGSFVLYTETMHADIAASLVMRTDLRQAVERNEFRLFFQPIYNIATHRVRGLETLVRWQHPQRGLVSPLEFIAMAEEIGLIREIGRWILREACLQLGVWRRAFEDLDLRLSVNVSGSELRDPAYFDELALVLAESGVEPGKLHLEITESVFLTQPDLIGDILARIRSLGVRIALDDFGTGFSSLGYIDRYPVDTIKIDRSFVGRMLSQHRTLAIMETIIKLGHVLNLQIVAEGVETEDQLSMLRSLNCRYAQGYFFARPMPKEATTVWLGAIE